MQFKDRTGQRYGRLVVVTRVVLARPVTWHCLCDCGTRVDVRGGNLGRGTNSCGCLRRDVMKKIKTKPLEHVILQMLWHVYRRNARSRNIRWHLTKNHFRNLMLGTCRYCKRTGTNPVTTDQGRLHAQGDRTLRVNGVDRLNNNGHYTVANSVSCCKDCNMAKGSKTEEAFLHWVRLVAKVNS